MDSVVRILSLCFLVAMVVSLPTPEETHIYIANICSQNCTNTENLCYAPVAKYCEKFIQCKLENNKWTGNIMSCAHGLFFDKTERRCLRPENVNCEKDRCKENPNLSDYEAGTDNCRHYWSCQIDNFIGPYSKAECCPENSTYINGKCDDTVHCNSSCLGDKKVDIECNLFEVTGKPKQYKNGNGPTSHVQECAGNMVFDLKSCGCIANDVQASNPNCKADIDIGYNATGFVNNNPRYWVGSYVSVNSQEIDGIKYSGEFTGKQYIEMPLYDGVNLHTIAGRIMFYPSDNSKKQILLSNCMPNVVIKRSFDFELNPSESTLTIKGRTDKKNKFKLEIKYKVNAWNTLYFLFKDSTLSARIIVNNQLVGSNETSGIQGAIEEVGAFRIGMCVNDGFHGRIKEITTYKCDPGTTNEKTAPAP